jgi:hypothetical protein
MREEHAIFMVIGTILVFLIVTFVYRKSREGFATAQAQEDYVAGQQKNFNPLGAALISAKTEGNLGTNTRPLLGTHVNVPTPEMATFHQEIDDRFPMKDGKSGVFSIIEKCEAVKNTDCSAFDDPAFKENCGMCLDIGENSQHEATMGGLVLLPDDRKYANDSAIGNFIPDYAPTLGKCPANKMVSTKEQCLRLKKELECAKNASYDIPGCSQCYADGTYFPVSPGTRQFEATIVLVGSGLLNFREVGYQQMEGIKLTDTPYTIYLKGPEGTRISFGIFPCTHGQATAQGIKCADDQMKKPPTIGGYITGETANGEMAVDIARIIFIEEYTNRKPLTKGVKKVNDIDVRVMSTGFGHDTAVFHARNPFTFMDTTSQEASRCQAGPYVTLKESAALLDSDPCYKKGSGPGKYSMECLQNTMDANGCFPEGKGYPKDPATAASLMQKGSTINDIANYIYEQAIITSTGNSMAGEKLTVPQISAASVFCTGREITSPCDLGNKDSGPLTIDCIDYLWKNEGDGKSFGPTYSRASQASGLFKTGNTPRFCQSSGTLAPIGEDGKPNNANIAFWQLKGGVDAVKAAMREIHSDANSEMLDDDKEAAILQCYGASLARRPKPSSSKSEGCNFQCGTSIRKVRIRQTNPDYFLQCGQIAIYNSIGDNVAIGKKPEGSEPGWSTQIGAVNNGKMLPNIGYLSAQRGTSQQLTIDLKETVDVISIVYYSTTAGIIQNWSATIVLDTLDEKDSVIDSRPMGSPANFHVFNYRKAGANPECLKCEVKTGKQIYWVARGSGGPEYSHVKDDAEQICRDFGGRSATVQQLGNAIATGIDPCVSGWAKAGPNGPLVNAKATYTYSDTGTPICNVPDASGIKAVSPDGNPQLSGVWCYGKKPGGDSSQFDGQYRKAQMDAYRPYFIRAHAPGIYTGPDSMPGNTI